ncbi:hypothetical protein [uncultured Mediterranean phage uvMED]|nr:hypothetical protein [uncultured Mediterranean phage uvMED]BAR19021.1 hypothetical protein [uncultured Mediterranean phage uvMED]BAR19117.1 hypothetical protein [uncultured Mediterranean phage uvMED]
MSKNEIEVEKIENVSRSLDILVRKMHTFKDKPDAVFKTSLPLIVTDLCKSWNDLIKNEKGERNEPREYPPENRV